jgi:hypothetical protein
MTYSHRQMRSTGLQGSDLERACGSARCDRTSVPATWTTRFGRPPGCPDGYLALVEMPWRGRHP